MPTGGFRCTLGQLVDEAFEVADGGRRVRPARLLGRLPWASMIHGSGTRPDPDCPEEEATDRAIAGLSPRMRDVLMYHWLSDLPADEKCKLWGLAERTYWRRINDARWQVKRALRI